MISRREFIAGAVALAVASRAQVRLAPDSESILVNDIHSQLNSTRVLEVLQPRSLEDVQTIIRGARKDRKLISVAGGRHAMGGQQFGTDTLLIDIRKLSRALHLDRSRGIVEVEAGIEWPELIDGYFALQSGDRQPWGIAQKQTGADQKRQRKSDLNENERATQTEEALAGGDGRRIVAQCDGDASLRELQSRSEAKKQAS